MTIDGLALRYSIELPDWVADELKNVPDILPTREDRMALVHRLAARNFVEGNGGPFAAIVIERETGRLVSIGVNVVLASGVSSAHAEVVALGMAQTRVGGWDLGGRDVAAHELVVNWRPCVQCYGATLWSGVTSLVVAGSGPELEEITTFDEGPMVDDWAQQFEARGISVLDGVLRDEAIAVFRDYATHTAAGKAPVYNARGTS